jgi:hypothetical protein
MPSSIESEILSRAETLVRELTALIRESALGIVQDALGAQQMPTRGGRVSRASQVKAPAGSAQRRPKGAKRDPRELEALTEKLGAFIKKSPGLRIEQIGKALGTPTKDLALPVKKLVAAKRISTKGQKRATTYLAR